MSKEPNLFDYINAFFDKKDIPYDKKKAGKYILVLWMSNDRESLEAVQTVCNKLFEIPDELVYQYLMEKIPRGKRWIKYPKKYIKESELEELQKEYPDFSRNELQEMCNNLKYVEGK